MQQFCQCIIGIFSVFVCFGDFTAVNVVKSVFRFYKYC